MENNTNVVSTEQIEMFNFIQDTIKGKYTANMPIKIDISYHRLMIPEQDDDIQINEDQDCSFLFGITS